MHCTVARTKFISNHDSRLFRLMLCGRLVYVGETFNSFADFGASTAVCRPGSAWTCSSAPPEALAVIRGGEEGKGRKMLEIGRAGRGKGRT